VRAQEAHAFFCDLCELQEGDHLEAAWVGSQLWLIPVLWVWDMLWVLRNRNLPSAIYSHVSLLILKFHTSHLAPAATLSSTCQDIMRPRLQFMRAADGIERFLSGF
jgi:hypothetical protein